MNRRTGLAVARRHEPKGRSMAVALRALYRTGVFSEKGKRIGRVSDVLFAPHGAQVVGFVVARPRLLMLLDRKDRYLALDRVKLVDGDIRASSGADGWDKGAAKRLGFSWDVTVVWQGMPARTESGASLGLVRDALFDPATGALSAVGLTAGATADLAVGVRDVPAALVRGFDGEAVVLSDEAAEAETSGGAAAAAGRTAAVAKQAAGDAVKTATVYGKAAAKAVGRSAAGKKAASWFKAVKDEVVDMMGEDDGK